METGSKNILVQSLGDFRNNLFQLIITDFIARILIFVLISPVIGLLLKIFLSTTSSGVVTDTAIIKFLLHPTGIAALLFFSTVFLWIMFLENGLVMVIGFASIKGRRIKWYDAFRYTLKNISAIIHLAWIAVHRLALIIFPFLAVCGSVYLLFLNKHDINYYLTDKPPEFHLSVVIVGLCFALTSLMIIYKISGWILALPMVLFEKTVGKQALAASYKAVLGKKLKISLYIVSCIISVLLISFLINITAFFLGHILVPSGSLNFTFILIVLGFVLLFSGVLHFFLALLSTVLFPLFLVRLYISIADPEKIKENIVSGVNQEKKITRKITGKIILICIACLFLITAGVGYIFIRSLDWDDHAQIIAHRGGAGVAPENTVAAFEQAISDGADWLELDVQENADGIVIIEHDRDFMRVASKNLDVYKSRSSDLADMDVGSFFDPAFSDQRIPLLGEVLELSRKRAGILIELKYYGHDHKLEERVVEIVESANMESEIMIMSLEYDAVQKTAALRPGWTYGLLNAVAIGDLTKLDVDFLAFTAKAASYSMIRRAHKSGMKVYVWTVDDPVQMSVMMSRGVDGIITDQVALVNKVKDMRKKLTPLGRFVIWIAGETGFLRGINISSARDDA
jgi:glycerophosphoryl diester phosphodiesterase